MQVRLVNFINRFIAKCAAEAVLTEISEEHPEKIARLQQTIANHGYPTPRSEKEGIFWKEYRARFEGYRP